MDRFSLARYLEFLRLDAPYYKEIARQQAVQPTFGRPADKPRENLKLASKDTKWGVHAEPFHGCYRQNMYAPIGPGPFASCSAYHRVNTISSFPFRTATWPPSAETIPKKFRSVMLVRPPERTS
jgi:hypothetical protein